MILFFDTETTGFFQDRLPVYHPDQPHIVQLAAQLAEDDGTVVSSLNFIVDNKVQIPTKASDVHGITTERAEALGLPPATVIELFRYLYEKADMLVAHNIKFDVGVTEAAIARIFGKTMRLAKPRFCTMEAASPIVNLPPTDRMIAAGFNKPKPPKLEECVQHFFGEKLEGAHDALIDVTACRRVFFHLKSLEKAQ